MKYWVEYQEDWQFGGDIMTASQLKAFKADIANGNNHAEITLIRPMSSNAFRKAAKQASFVVVYAHWRRKKAMYKKYNSKGAANKAIAALRLKGWTVSKIYRNPKRGAVKKHINRIITKFAKSYNVRF